MTSITENNKRIAKNTAFLYLRMLIVMFVSLYTSRIVLQVLGVSDFGIYNVVGGIVSMLAFFTSSLSNATQRFINIGLGLNDIKKTEESFKQSMTLMLLISVILFLLGETIGLWFVYNKLVVPLDRINAALWVYQFSLLSIISSINQVPFMGAIVAHERMNMYAYLGLFEAFARLLIVYVLLMYSSVDSLILYSGLTTLVSWVTILFYIIYCVRNFPECKCQLYWNKKLVSEMFRFVAFNVYGCLSWSLGITGTNILLNLFFGPVVNAARGISVQVSSIVNRFTESIITAVKPQIIKAYANGDKEYMVDLVQKSSKYSFLLSAALAIPVIIEIEFLLKLWLGEVPAYTVVFTRIVLCEMVISSLVPPLWTAANATGNIKRSQVYGRTFTLLVLPLSYVALKMGAESYFPFILSVIAQIAYCLYLVYDIHIQVDLQIKQYLIKVAIPSLLFAIGLLGVWIIVSFINSEDSLLRFIEVTILTVIIIPPLLYLTLDKEEKSLLNKKLYNIKTKFSKHID